MARDVDCIVNCFPFVDSPMEESDLGISLDFMIILWMTFQSRQILVTAYETELDNSMGPINDGSNNGSSIPDTTDSQT